MPIVGLTDRGPSLPEVGILRKGAPKTDPKKPGSDLKYFRFDTGDAEAGARFKEIYGPEPVAIRVFLPFATTDENFEAWKEEWAASSLKHRCDGRDMVLWLKGGAYSTERKPCPGGCKQVGRLKVIIPELKRWAFVTALTTSIHDILQLHANLQALEAARGDLRGIPLILKRAPRKISTPRGGGERARAEKWLLTIEAQPQWVELQLASAERQALGQGQPLALPEWNGDDDEEEEIETPAAAPAPEMITDAQVERLNEIVEELETLGVTRENWRQGIVNFTRERTDEIAELTNEEAAKVINAFGKRLDEKRAAAERKGDAKEIAKEAKK